MTSMTNLIDYFEEEYGLKLPKHKIVCPRCDGEGTHVNPSIDGNGITSEEWAEWDDDEREGYFSGRYDVICEECDGLNVVDEVDESLLDSDTYNDWQEWLRSDRETEAIYAAERRMGA